MQDTCLAASHAHGIHVSSVIIIVFRMIFDIISMIDFGNNMVIVLNREDSAFKVQNLKKQVILRRTVYQIFEDES